MIACRGGTGGTFLTAKGLDMSLAALQRQDPCIKNIIDVASQVALYTFNNETTAWEKTDVEGTLFVYTRLASPKHGFIIMNRLSMDNLTEPITKDLDFQLQDPFLLYRNARLSIYGIWFYDKEDCQRIAELTKNLTMKEQQLHSQSQNTLICPQQLQSKDRKGKDILQMLTKARDEYDKGKLSSEPKEIGSGGELHDNPNLIKPIPLKPKGRQQSVVQECRKRSPELNQQHEETESKHLSVATHSGIDVGINSVSLQPRSHQSAVARSLSYDDPSLAAGGTVVLATPSQHCPAIQKLMNRQRVQVMPLQPLSEAPENRLCKKSPQETRPDPFKRLFQPSLPYGLSVPSSMQRVVLAFKDGCQVPPKSPALMPQQFTFSRPTTVPAPLATATVYCPQVGIRVISSHELLKKLQFIQNEQFIESSHHILAPSFQQLSLQHNSTSANNITAPAKKNTPLCIPPTEAHDLLLSPSVFSHGKGACREQEETQSLSRTQLQATLLHLIKNDTSFLDTVFKAYVSSVVKDTNSK